MLQILDLITFERPAITLEEISREVGYTVSTSYRYVRELTAVGLLAAIGGGKYTLGARIIELDLLARRTDPVLLSGKEFVDDLLARIPVGVVMICELRGTRVVSVIAERTSEGHVFHHERGHTMALFRGSAAKAILVHLPNRRLARLFNEFKDEIADAGLGGDWRSFIKRVSALRREPYILSKGELNPKNFALSAPVFYANGSIAGSLNVIVPLTNYSDRLVAEIARPLVDAAAAMNARLSGFAAASPAQAASAQD